MIRLKSKEEIRILREGGRILASILDVIAKKVIPGATTGELEKLADSMIKEAGGRPAFKNYVMPNELVFPTALCVAINNEVVHSPALPTRVLESGDIIGLDMGMEYPLQKKVRGKPYNKLSRLGGFYTDMAKTVAVGKVNKKVRKLLQVAEKSLTLGIKQVKPGNTLDDIGQAIQNYAESRGFSVVRELVGHGVGYDVHEAPQIAHYKVTDGSLANAVLKPGMVIAIEPMINMGDWPVKLADDGFTYLTKDGSLSAQFEHTVAVTNSGCEVLTLGTHNP